MASLVASAIYRQWKPQKGLQQRMTGLLMKWMKQGATLAEVAQRVLQLFFPATTTAMPAAIGLNRMHHFNAVNTNKPLRSPQSGYIPLRI
ncbi:MAG: hypothetical protein EKK39_12000 [Sphingobacteriales bacterium]|uniref:hypothetical protein n=1 Tax=Hydrotalea flava TaxID=714549 RepID=UPI000FC26E27|nr:hypothetical protein [Hydrotalea flava]RTL48860.1 MAG: hypothetical protein EKK39_12000 [Sphingobacteriales bacterium]